VEVTGSWRDLQNEELHSFSSPYMIRAIKSRRMKWAENFSIHGKDEKCKRKRKGRKLLGKLNRPHGIGIGIDGSIILKWILKG
jgi:hypothetical protein